VNQLLQWLVDTLKGARCWFVVLPWERSVRVRFGKHVRVYGPGWHWRIPLLDHVRTFNNRLRVAQFPSLTVTTLDGRTVTAAGLIGFRITDPLKAMLALQEPEYTCAALAMGQLASVLSRLRFDSVAVGDLESAALAHLEDSAPGITVDFVRLVDYAAVRTYRLLQDQWRPSTQKDDKL